MRDAIIEGNTAAFRCAFGNNRLADRARFGWRNCGPGRMRRNAAARKAHDDGVRRKLLPFQPSMAHPPGQTMPFRYRHRRWIALLALLGLLFQQLAMASYVCPMENTTPSPVAALAKVPPCHIGGSPTDKARCQQHCFPQPPSSDHPPMPTVPAMLPATTWLPAPDDRLPGTHGTSASRLVASATAPPLTIQHCTFQI